MPDTVERRLADLRVVIDRETCIATENCVEVAPEVFQLDDEGICRFEDGGGNVDRETVLEACRICPVAALSAFDKDGKQLVP